MKEIPLSLNNPQHYVDPYDQLTDYVLKLAEKIAPFGKEEWYTGFTASKAYIMFNRRYLENKVNTSFINKYEGDKNLKDIITTLGYDFDKFWYLLLFITDYSYCACKKEIEFHKDKYEYLEDLKRYIAEEGSELTIRVKGKKKVEITESGTLKLIQSIIKEHIDSVGERSIRILSPKHKSFNIVKKNSKSYHIWYFATLFLMFYELVPPKNIRKKKGDINSYSKKLLISKLIHLVEIDSEDVFLADENIINGFLKQYKTSSIHDKIVLSYW